MRKYLFIIIAVAGFGACKSASKDKPVVAEKAAADPWAKKAPAPVDAKDPDLAKLAAMKQRQIHYCRRRRAVAPGRRAEKMPRAAIACAMPAVEV